VGRIVGNSDVSQSSATGRWFPIGNLTSQFFVDVYLDPLGYFIKDDLGFKCYLRYTEDLVLF